MDVIDRIESERKRQGLSLRALARRSGLSGSTVQRIEARSLDPTLSTLTTLLDALGLGLTVGADAGVGRSRRSDVLRQSAAIRRLGADHGITNIRLVGSVARDEAAGESDVDLLVDVGAEAGLLSIEQFRRAVEEVVGASVDVITGGSVAGPMRSVLDDAIPV